MFKRKGQSTVEYAMIIAVVVGGYTYAALCKKRLIRKV